MEKYSYYVYKWKTSYEIYKSIFVNFFLLEHNYFIKPVVFKLTGNSSEPVVAWNGPVSTLGSLPVKWEKSTQSQLTFKAQFKDVYPASSPLEEGD